MESYQNSTAATINFTSNDYNEQTVGIGWIIFTFIYIIFILAGLWTLVSLIVFGVKAKKWSHNQINEPEKLNAGIIYTFTIACTLTCICTYVSAIVSLNVGYDEQQDEVCDTVADIYAIFYLMVLLSVNSFLWFRQRVFFTNQMLNIEFTKPIKVFSHSSIFVIYIGGMTSLILASIPNDMIASIDGCVYEPDETFRAPSFILGTAVMMFGQVSLLSLFVYVLIKNSNISLNDFCKCLKHKDKAKRFGGKTSSSFNASPSMLSSTVSNSTKCKLKSSEIVKTIIKKTFLFAVSGFTADLIYFVASFYFSKTAQQRKFVELAGTVDVSLNLIFVLLSFAQWKQMIFSFCVTPSRINK